mmetsp:Transcript_91054/g.221011  ORF Transcript_91054/g.221011 Transcript_91054/m.221011 type:complete len:205 (-) Transcript_91054:897-1511(-)
MRQRLCQRLPLLPHARQNLAPKHHGALEAAHLCGDLRYLCQARAPQTAAEAGGLHLARRSPRSCCRHNWARHASIYLLLHLAGRGQENGLQGFLDGVAEGGHRSLGQLRLHAVLGRTHGSGLLAELQQVPQQPRQRKRRALRPQHPELPVGGRAGVQLREDSVVREGALREGWPEAVQLHGVHRITLVTVQCGALRRGRGLLHL